MNHLVSLLVCIRRATLRCCYQYSGCWFIWHLRKCLLDKCETKCDSCMSSLALQNTSEKRLRVYSTCMCKLSIKKGVWRCCYGNKKKTKAVSAFLRLLPSFKCTHTAQSLALAHIFITHAYSNTHTHVLLLQRVTLKIHLQLPWQGFYKYQLKPLVRNNVC